MTDSRVYSARARHVTDRHDKSSATEEFNSAYWSKSNSRSVRIFDASATDGTCRGPHGGTASRCSHSSSYSNSCPDSAPGRSSLHRRPLVSRTRGRDRVVRPLRRRVLEWYPRGTDRARLSARGYPSAQQSGDVVAESSVGIRRASPPHWFRLLGVAGPIGPGAVVLPVPTSRARRNPLNTRRYGHREGDSISLPAGKRDPDSHSTCSSVPDGRRSVRAGFLG